MEDGNWFHLEAKKGQYEEFKQADRSFHKFDIVSFGIDLEFSKFQDIIRDAWGVAKYYRRYGSSTEIRNGSIS